MLNKWGDVILYLDVTNPSCHHPHSQSEGNTVNISVVTKTIHYSLWGKTVRSTGVAFSTVLNTINRLLFHSFPLIKDYPNPLIL